MTSIDPERLAERDSNEALRRAIEAGRRQGPTGAQLRELRAALGLPEATVAQMPQGDPASAAATGAARLGDAGVVLKLVGGALVAGLVAYGATSPRQAANAPGPAAGGLQPTAAPQPAPAAPRAAPAPLLGARRPQAMRARAAEAKAADAGAAEAPQLAGVRPNPLRRSTPGQERERDAPSGDPQRELALLARARAHLRSAPGRALTLVDEHARLFPRGVLSEEREVIAIEALLRSGERAAAEARAARFERRFAGSAHARRVAVLLREVAPAP